MTIHAPRFSPGFRPALLIAALGLAAVGFWGCSDEEPAPAPAPDVTIEPETELLDIPAPEPDIPEEPDEGPDTPDTPDADIPPQDCSHLDDGCVLGEWNGSECVLVANAGAPCDDEDICTLDDACQSDGTCAGTPRECADENPCTEDGCDELTGACTNIALPDGTVCDDGDSCTEQETCSFGFCIPGFVHPGWGQPFGDIADDAGYALTLVPGATGWVVAGSTASQGAGGQDGWINRVSINGNSLWDTVSGGTDWDVIEDIAVRLNQDGSAGGFVTAGWTYSAGSAGLEDMWVLSTDAEGGVRWENTYGGTDTDKASSVVILPNGGLALAGWTWSDDTPYGDGWLVLTDAEGVQIGDVRLGGDLADRIYDMAITHPIPDTEQHLVMAGSSNSIGAKGIDAWVIRTDQHGEVIWDNRYGQNGTERAHAVAMLPGGDIVVAGYSATNVTAGGSDAMLMRLDADGNEIWTKYYGGGQDEFAHGVTVRELDTDNDGVMDDVLIVAVGSTRTNTLGEEDLYIFGVNGDGEVQWENNQGLQLVDIGYAIEVLEDGYAVAGVTTDLNFGDEQMWTLRTDMEGNVCQ